MRPKLYGVWSEKTYTELGHENETLKKRLTVAEELLREACNSCGDSSNLYCGAWVHTSWIKRAEEVISGNMS